MARVPRDPDSWTWFKSSKSKNEPDCVEAALDADEGVGIRDSKNRGAGFLHVSRDSWHGLMARVKRHDAEQ
jgi:hypothetical protein